MTAARSRNRRGEGDRLRDEILAAVNRLLDQEGSDAKLTMRAVAKEAGVAAPSIYLQFADKTELVWAALESKYGDLATQMQRAADDCGGGTRDRLLVQAETYCRSALENPGHYRLMFEVRQPEVDRSRLSTHPARLVANQFRQAFAACAEDGYQLSLPLYQAAHTLLAGLHGIVSLEHSLVPGLPDQDLINVSLGLAQGLVDNLVSRRRVRAATLPEPTLADRRIAATVLHQSSSVDSARQASKIHPTNQ